MATLRKKYLHYAITMGGFRGGEAKGPCLPQDGKSYFMCNNKVKNCMLSQYMQKL